MILNDEIKKSCSNEKNINKISINPNNNNEKNDIINSNEIPIKKNEKIDINETNNDNFKNYLNELKENININELNSNNNRKIISNNIVENSNNDCNNENLFKRITTLKTKKLFEKYE